MKFLGPVGANLQEFQEKPVFARKKKTGEITGVISSVFLPVGYSLIGAIVDGLSRVPSSNLLLYLSVSLKHSLNAPDFRVGLPMGIGMFQIAVIRFHIAIKFYTSLSAKSISVFYKKRSKIVAFALKTRLKFLV